MRRRGRRAGGFGRGAGASPFFPPQHPSTREAKAELQEIVHRSPRLSNLPQSRWTLEALTQVVSWLAGLTRGGVHRILDRFRIHYRRGQRHVHSPDLEYDVKLTVIAAVQVEVRAAPGRKVFLYQDELTSDRRPTVSQAYTEAGGPGRPSSGTGATRSGGSSGA